MPSTNWSIALTENTRTKIALSETHSSESWTQVKGEPCVFQGCHWSFCSCRTADVQNKTPGHIVKVKAEFPVLAKSLLLCKLSQKSQYLLPSGVFSHMCCNSKKKRYIQSLAQGRPTSKASAGRNKGSRGGAERSPRVRSCLGATSSLPSTMAGFWGALLTLHWPLESPCSGYLLFSTGALWCNSFQIPLGLLLHSPALS